MNINTLTHEERKHVLSKIKEMMASDGWTMTLQIMAQERDEFMRKMVAPTSPITNELWHYNRGIMEASYAFAALPEKLASQLTNLVQFHEKVEAAQAPMPTPTQETSAPVTH